MSDPSEGVEEHFLAVTSGGRAHLFSNLEQVLPLAKVATVAQAFRDLERRNYAAFHALSGLTGHLRGLPIFSTGLVEMSREAIPFGQNSLQKGVQASCSSSRSPVQT
jgi:hypothetical protein